MPGMFSPSQFTGMDKFYNQQSPAAYDPTQYVDPLAAIQMQQEYAKQIFQMNNPRQALPQQFGAALGGFAQQLMGQGGQGQQPQQAQGAQGPQTPVGQDVHSRYLTNLQSGMSQGEALYQAAHDSEASGKFDGDPMAEKVYDKATTWAVDKYKFDPKVAQEAKLKPAENFVNNKTGERRTAQPGTPEYNQILASGEYNKAADVPQEANNTVKEYKSNGLYHSQIIGPDGKIAHSFSSTQPIQYGATVTGDDAKTTWPNGPKTFGNADAAANTTALTNRSIATKNALDSIDLLDKTATGMAIGKPGDIAEHISNTRSTIGTLAGQLGLSSDPDSYKMNWAPATAPQLDKWNKAGVDAEKVKSLFLETALLDEATNGDKNASDANRKFSVEQHMKILGEDSSNPDALHATLMQRRSQLVSQLNNEFEGKPGVMSKPPWLQSENQKASAGTAPHPGWTKHTDKNGVTAWVSPDKTQYEVIK